MFFEKEIKPVQFEIHKNAWMWPLCSEFTMFNIIDVSVRETKEKSDNPALLHKTISNPALLGEILFWDKRFG